MTTEIEKKIQDKLYLASDNNNLKIIKHILENNSLNKHVNLEDSNCRILRTACYNSNEEIIDYLLTIPEIKKNAHHIINDIFGLACSRENFNQINFFYKKEKYKSYLDFTSSDSWFFRAAYKNKKIKVLEFLILEVGLTRDDNNIVRIMRNENIGDKEIFQSTIELFNKQKLFKNLNKNLEEKQLIIKKPKI